MKCSVIVTTKNRELFLKIAVFSILKGDFKPIDIIVVNDGGSPIVLELFPNVDNVIVHIINNPVSLGGNKARNQGAIAARGDYLFFLDDDDVYTESAISDKLKVFASNPDVGLVFTGVQYVYSDSLEKVERVRVATNNIVSFKGLLANGNIVGPTSCAAVRKGLFIEAGMFDENLDAMQDYELWIRMAKRNIVMNDGGVNLIYTIHSSGTQISSKYERYISA